MNLSKSLVSALILVVAVLSSSEAQVKRNSDLNVFKQTRTTSLGNWENVYGYKNSSGETVIEAIFQKAFQFSDDLAAVMLKNLWGYIDDSYPKTKRFYIGPTFDLAFSFRENIARIGKFTNKMPELLDDWHKVKKPSNDEYAVLTELSPIYGYIDKTYEVNRKYLIEPQFIDACDFSEDVASVKSNDVWGFIDGEFGKTGNYFVKPQFDGASSFKEDLALVFTEEGFGYISKDFSKTGKYFIEPQFYLALSFSEGLAMVCLNQSSCGYIDKSYPDTKKFVIPPIYRRLSLYRREVYFKNDTATVWDSQGKVQTIDKQGRVLDSSNLQPLYDDVDYTRWFMEQSENGENIFCTL